jgi:hypothetical protein
MCDGSLHRDGKTMILHTQSFSQEDNLLCSIEMEKNFGLLWKVIPHKKKYWVLSLDPTCSKLLAELIAPSIHSSMMYKIPTGQ